jgi:hypothetical protein
MTITVLDVANKCLNDMNSFQVNSISDTEEALQVASIIEDKYYSMLETMDWPVDSDYLPLVTSAANAGPTTLSIPVTVHKIDHLRYNTLSLKYRDPEVFFSTALDPSNASNENMELVQFGPNIQGYVLNNKDPEFFTSFDDELIVCDSFNADNEDKLVATKSLAKVTKHQVITIDDSTPIPITKKMQPYFLSECRAAAFKKIKQQVSDEDERDRKIHRSRLQTEAKKQQDKDTGSKSGGFGRNRGQRSSGSASWWTTATD